MNKTSYDDSPIPDPPTVQRLWQTHKHGNSILLVWNLCESGLSLCVDLSRVWAHPQPSAEVESSTLRPAVQDMRWYKIQLISSWCDMLIEYKFEKRLQTIAASNDLTVFDVTQL